MQDDETVESSVETSDAEPEGVEDADLSILALIGNDPEQDDEAIVPLEPQNQVAVGYLKQVHGGRMPHFGAKRTWQLLNKYFPGHGVPVRLVQDFVAECPRCQKDARRTVCDIQPAVRTLLPDGNRVQVGINALSRMGIDSLKITSIDKNGNAQAIVMVNHMTKHVSIYPAKDYDARTAATALFTYYCRFGGFDELASDPGSKFLSDTVQQLNNWLGIRHKVSLVDVYTSNGVWQTNGEVLRHLRALCNDGRIRNEWSNPENICLVEFILNERVSTETRHSAFELTFGSADLPYFRKLALGNERISNVWLRKLNESLQTLRRERE
jgi:hypothetical protein